MTAQYQVVKGIVAVPDAAGIGEQRRIDSLPNAHGHGARTHAFTQHFRVGELIPSDAMPPAEFLRLVELGVLVVVT